jgi:sarcosine oxidase
VADEDIGIFEEQGGFLRPERAVVAAARRAEDLGARIVRDTVVERIEPHSGGVRIHTAGGAYEARHAVVSVGAWLQTLLRDLRLPVRVTRQLASWWPVERPDEVAPERFPVFIRDIGGSITADSSFYGFPTQDAATIKVAIHREGATAHPDTIDRTVTADELAPVQEHISRYLVGVGNHPVRTSVCMYTNTPDHDFLIGSPPDMTAITVLGGFSGHGFKFASVIGEIGADFATQGGTDYPVAWLSPDRFLSQSIRSGQITGRLENEND